MSGPNDTEPTHRHTNSNINLHHSIPITIPRIDTDDDAAAARGYNLSGRIMLTAIILLFFFVLLMLSLHLYARWYLNRAQRRLHIRRNLRRRRSNIVFYLPDSPTTAAAFPRGLDAALIASLPVFTYDPRTRPDNPQDCAVCLSEFEPGESGRVLPKCKHAFHTDCIDIWFHSHATCPLCRAPVEPGPPESESLSEVVITVSEPDTGSSSGSGRNRTGNEMRKPFSVTVEVPARGGEGFRRDDSGRDSPSSFRSPVSRMLSFKRMLSRERKGSVSPSSGGGGGGGGCSSSAELSEAERGETR